MDVKLSKWIDGLGYQVGRHTYGSPVIWSALIYKESTSFSIGKYCSISGEIDIVMANHRTNWVSTYPFAIYRSFWPGSNGEDSDHIAKPITVGNDVWIGAHSCLLPGCKIGDGAVVAAYSVVRGTVPPYAIVAGNPSEIVGYRFSPEIVDRLLSVKWWDWPDYQVDRYLPLMMTENIEEFLRAVEKEVVMSPSIVPITERKIIPLSSSRMEQRLIDLSEDYSRPFLKSLQN